MKKYLLYDNIIEKEKSSSFITATKELLAFFNKEIKTIKNAPQDIGCDKLALNLNKFHYNNAKTLALANREDSDILCIEDSSFLSLSLTKLKLSNNIELKNEINSKLKKEDLEFNLQTDILPLNLYIRDEIGYEEISKSVKNSFKEFYTSLYLGSFQCDLEQFNDLAIYKEILKLTDINLIKYSLYEQSCGYEIKDINSSTAFKMAGTLMLDMFDNATDFVIVNDARAFVMFDNYQKELENSVKREIGLSIFNLAQTILLSCGVTDKKRLGLDRHKQKTEIV